MEYSHPDSRSVGAAYGVWLFCLIGFCGIHRIYCGKVGTGILWFLTLGLLGIGQIVDLFLIPGMVRDYNARLYASTHRSLALKALDRGCNGFLSTHPRRHG